MGSLGPSNSLWDREFDTILIDLDDTLYHRPEIPAQVRQNIEGAWNPLGVLHALIKHDSTLPDIHFPTARIVRHTSFRSHVATVAT